jgi:hypothetical protein
MIAATARRRVTPLLLFIKTLFDIALLRKGPQHIPRSGILLLLAALLWIVAVLAALVLIDRFDERDVVLEFFSVLIAVVCYSAIVIGARQGPRLTQTITAILGCGALLTAQHLGSLGFEAVDRGVFTIDIIAQWRVRHRLTHCRCGPCHGVAAQINIVQLGYPLIRFWFWDINQISKIYPNFSLIACKK